MGCGGSKPEAAAPAATPAAAPAPKAAAPTPAAAPAPEKTKVEAICIEPDAGDVDNRPLNSPGKAPKASEMTDADWEANSGKVVETSGPTHTFVKKGEGAQAVPLPGAPVTFTGEGVEASAGFRKSIAEAKAGEKFEPTIEVLA